jgi:hypothetical protein
VGIIKLLHSHLQRILKQFISFDVLLFYLVEDAIGEVDDPVNRMLIGKTGENYYCLVELNLCLL